MGLELEAEEQEKEYDLLKRNWRKLKKTKRKLERLVEKLERKQRRMRKDRSKSRGGLEFRLIPCGESLIFHNSVTE